jgi:lysophospholipase L1-like esterase
MMMNFINKRNGFIATLTAIVILGALGGFAQKYVPEEGSQELTKKKRKGNKVTMDPNLPNVLIIGDSISIGYTGMVRTQLTGKANVIHNPGNAQGTTLGLIKLKAWLGDTKWDVIHFNWGLHDLKHVTKAGTSNNSNDPNDPQQADHPTYIANMEVLVTQLKATDSTLIFATTTPYPEGVKPYRLPEDAAKYNDAALKIMNANEIQVNDLYSLILPKLDTLQKPVNVHFTKEGYKLLADQVTAVIESTLQKHNAMN